MDINDISFLSSLLDRSQESSPCSPYGAGAALKGPHVKLPAEVVVVWQTATRAVELSTTKTDSPPALIPWYCPEKAGWTFGAGVSETALSMVRTVPDKIAVLSTIAVGYFIQLLLMCSSWDKVMSSVKGKAYIWP